MEYWFTPWRYGYLVSERSSEGCLLCRIGSAAADRENLVLLRGREHYVLINRYPYNNGHLMIVPYAHSAYLRDLGASAGAEMMGLAAACEEALRRTYSPEGINVGLNLGRSAGAGIEDHLHLHVVPRWGGDTNFMTVVGGARIVPEDLDVTYARLQPLLAELGRV